MHFLPSSVSHDDQNTRLSIKSFSREMEMVEKKCFENGLGINGTIGDSDKFVVHQTTFVAFNYFTLFEC